MSEFLTAHLAILPVLLPAGCAVLLLLAGDGGTGAGSVPAGLRRQRRLAGTFTVLMLLVAIRLAVEANAGLTVYRVGDWPAPFGIVLVVDRLSALMLVLNACIALPVLLFASAGWDRRGRHFHALFQFQLMGLNGAFVTGDLFNLFVFFEVLLIASYALMLHGGGRERLLAGVHYVVLNLAASVLFLMGVALIYAITGTLNLADLALRVPRVEAPQAALLQVAGLLLLVVFGFKAALMPMSMWLPATYASTSAPVAAMFAILTKVGVYAIVRVHGVVFGADGAVAHVPGAPATAFAVQSVLLPAALVTSVAAVLGVLGSRTLPRMVAWLTVASVATVLTALGIEGVAAWAAGLYYMAQSTLAVAGLFLLAELIGSQRGALGGKLDAGPPLARPGVLGGMLLLGAVSVAGLPPLAGFIGKLMILQAAAAHAWAVAIWVFVLAVGFLTLLGTMRAGIVLCWDVHGDPAAGSAGGVRRRELLAMLVPFAAVAAMSIFAAPLHRYVEAAARQIGDRDGYARAVLDVTAGAPVDSTRPYRPSVGAMPR